MVLEASLLCLYNSDWTRNGDYFPSRFRIQVEAANFIIENRCDANPENSIGIMTMAGKRVEMVTTLTNDESRLLGSINNINLNGESDLISALNIAILCLKHRINKNQKQRIILFVGSPVKATKENLVQIGKKLRKYNVAVDIISFGNVEENKESLNTLLNEVNNSNNSSILEVEIGSNIVDALFTSSIIGANNVEQDNVGGQGANPQGNQQPMQLSQFERDMNLALQMSLEEAKKNENKGGTATPSNINAAAEKNKTLEEIEEEQELENARLLSIQENNKVVQKENEAKEKKAANEILESQAFLNDLLNQVDEGDNSAKKEEDKKDDKKDDKTKGENKKDDKNEDKKDGKTKGDDKMDIEK